MKLKLAHKKKGQVFQGFQTLAISVVGLAIMLIVAFLIIGEGRDQAISLIDATIVANETVASVTDTAVALGTPDLVSVTCDSVLNGSISVVPAANFTCDTAGFTINDDAFEDCCNVSYTAIQKDLAVNSTDTLKTAVDIVPDFVSIIIIAVIGAALISIVTLFRRRRS